MEDRNSGFRLIGKKYLDLIKRYFWSILRQTVPKISRQLVNSLRPGRIPLRSPVMRLELSLQDFRGKGKVKG